MIMYDVVTIGSATRDVFIKLKDGDFKVVDSDDFVTQKGLCFSLGSKIEITDLSFAPGGGGVNTSVTFARQGLKTANVGVIGSDVGGNEILKYLRDEGVDTKFFVVRGNGEGTAYSVILTAPGGERTILSYKGEGQNFDEKEIRWDEIQSQWLYLDSLGGNYGLFKKAIEFGAGKGMRIAMNPGGKELAHGLEKLRPYLGKIKIFATNREEAARLTGIDYKNEKEIFRFMDELIDGIYIMTKGPEGAVVSDGKNIYRTGPSEGKAIERTGAGDAFNSGFVAQYIRSGGDIRKALNFAMANAQSVVSYAGATTGVLRGDSVPPLQIEVEPL